MAVTYSDNQYESFWAVTQAIDNIWTETNCGYQSASTQAVTSNNGKYWGSDKQ